MTTDPRPLPPVARLRRFFTYDPDEGRLRWRYSRASQGIQRNDLAAHLDTASGYLKVSMFGHQFKEHRLIWKFCYEKDPEGDIDHINRDKTDNRIDNLRDVSVSVNQRNRNNWKGFRGVFRLSSGKFRASITVDGKTRHIGTYRNEIDAAIAYDEVAIELFGSEAQTNF